MAQLADLKTTNLNDGNIRLISNLLSEMTRNMNFIVVVIEWREVLTDRFFKSLQEKNSVLNDI